MNNSKITDYIVEISYGGRWQRVYSDTSHGIAKLKARTLALAYPLHPIRIREHNLIDWPTLHEQARACAALARPRLGGAQ